MIARFRIRTREGEELEPRTLEIFSELVRSGVVRPQDLVFDALTGEWAPANVHPMVRLFQDPLVDGPLGGTFSARPRGGAHGPGGDAPGGGGAQTALALDLVEAPDVSPEEEARAFIEQMEEERRNDPDRNQLALELPLVTTRSATTATPVAPAAAAHTVVAHPHATRPATVPVMVPERSRVRAPHRAGEGARRVRSRAARTWAMAVGLGLIALAALATMARPSFRVGDALPGTVADVAVRAPRAVPHTETEIRLEAYHGFLRALDGLRARLGVGEVPSVWLEGRYLAGARAFPEVRRFWERYLAYAETARASEATLFREAYLEAVSSARVSGPLRSLRLAAAVEDFASARLARDAHYAQVRELAASAMALHDLMVELEGRVTWEPIRGRGVSADPVLEAAGADPEAQVRLEAALDRVLLALGGSQGTSAGDRSAVGGWLADGLREVGLPR